MLLALVSAVCGQCLRRKRPPPPTQLDGQGEREKGAFSTEYTGHRFGGVIEWQEQTMRVDSESTLVFGENRNRAHRPHCANKRGEDVGLWSSHSADEKRKNGRWSLDHRDPSARRWQVREMKGFAAARTPGVVGQWERGVDPRRDLILRTGASGDGGRGTARVRPRPRRRVPLLPGMLPGRRSDKALGEIDTKDATNAYPQPGLWAVDCGSSLLPPKTPQGKVGSLR